MNSDRFQFASFAFPDFPFDIYRFNNPKMKRKRSLSLNEWGPVTKRGDVSFTFYRPLRVKLFGKVQNGERFGKISTNEWLHFV